MGRAHGRCAKHEGSALRVKPQKSAGRAPGTRKNSCHNDKLHTHTHFAAMLYVHAAARAPLRAAADPKGDECASTKAHNAKNPKKQRCV